MSLGPRSRLRLPEARACDPAQAPLAAECLAGSGAATLGGRPASSPPSGAARESPAQGPGAPRRGCSLSLPFPTRPPAPRPALWVSPLLLHVCQVPSGGHSPEPLARLWDLTRLLKAKFLLLSMLNPPGSLWTGVVTPLSSGTAEAQRASPGWR